MVLDIPGLTGMPLCRAHMKHLANGRLNHISMKAHADESISDEDFAKASERWPEDTPQTKEAYLIRQIFDGTPTILDATHSVTY